jgi:sensor histidine kinase YesM
VAVIVAAALGVWLMMYWWGWLNIRPGVKEGWWYNSTPTQFVKHFVRYLTIGALFAASITMYRRERLRNEALLQTEIAQAQLGQQLDEARLQALLAQIEPHFLFNTLANVRGLYQSDAAAAKRMLENLRRYLTVALPRMRESDSTIGREAALAEAYLAIQQIRMGKRLAFSIHVPANLQHAPLPPMMLLTLVENAIKHGLGQLPEGGTIAIMVSQDDGLLSVRVADSGRGFAKQLGNGAGLANIRARLAALHGEAGRLRLARNTPRGVTATIVVPWTGPEAC